MVRLVALSVVKLCMGIKIRITIRRGIWLRLRGGEKASIGLAILSWFIPLAGLIIFLVKKDKEPKTANVSSICALISFSLSLILSIGIFVFTFLFANNMISSIENSNLATPEVSDDMGKIPDDYAGKDDERVFSSDLINKETQSMLDNVLENGNTESNSDDGEVNTESHEGDNVNASSDWKTYKFLVNGKELALPCSYIDLSQATGLTFRLAELKSYLNSGYYSSINLYNSEDNLGLYSEILNDTDEDKLYTDCKITRVSQTAYQVESNNPPVISFPGDLKVGMELTKDKLKSMFGEPQDSYDYADSDYVVWSFTYSPDKDFTTFDSYEINVINGVIDEIVLDHRNG